MAAAWAAPYIGLPYLDHGRDRAGCDCWGGVRLVYREVFGRDLPSLADLYVSADHAPSVARTVQTGIEQCFDRVVVPAEGDMVILRIYGRPWHCGIMVSSDRFLHWPAPPRGKPGIGACIERLDSAAWVRRVDGFYRVRAT